MKSIAHRELRNNSSEILRRVAAGETIAVTNHGEVAAVLVPPALSELERLIQAGRVRLARRRLRFSGLPRTRGVTSAEVLADLRGDR